MKAANETGVSAQGNSQNDVTELISLPDLLAVIYRGRRYALIIVIASVALSLLFATSPIGNYRSEGYFAFGGRIPPDPHVSSGARKHSIAGIESNDFDRFLLFTSRLERFNEYKGYRDYEPKQAMNNVQNVMTSPALLKRSIAPVYANESDAPNPVADGRRGDVIGLRIHYDGGSPEEAQQTAAVLGRYVMDSIIYAVSLERLPVLSDEATAEADDLIAQMASENIELRKSERRIAALRGINFGSSGGSTKVLVIGEDELHYASAQALLMAIEMQVTDAKKKIEQTDRAVRKALLIAGYRREAVKALENTRSGVNLIKDMDQVKRTYFEDKKLDDAIVKEVYEAIGKENSAAIDLYLHRSRFVVGPGLPKKSPTHLALVASVALIFGLMLSIVLLLLRNGWRQKSVEREQDIAATSAG